MYLLIGMIITRYMVIFQNINSILGDFSENISNSGPIYYGISTLIFFQLVTEPTNVLGGVIDHVMPLFRKHSKDGSVN